MRMAYLKDEVDALKEKKQKQRELAEFKFIVTPVFLVKEGSPSNNKVVGEKQADPVVVYGLDGMRKLCDDFYAELARLNIQATE